MENKEIIEIMQRKFPKFTKMQLSMIKNKDKYGVDFCAEAKRHLRGCKQKANKQPNKQTKRLRINEQAYKKLENYAITYGYKSVSEYVNLMFGGDNDKTDSD